MNLNPEKSYKLSRVFYKWSKNCKEQKHIKTYISKNDSLLKIKDKSMLCCPKLLHFKIKIIPLPTQKSQNKDLTLTLHNQKSKGDAFLGSIGEFNYLNVESFCIDIINKTKMQMLI